MKSIIFIFFLLICSICNSQKFTLKTDLLKFCPYDTCLRQYFPWSNPILDSTFLVLNFKDSSIIINDIKFKLLNIVEKDSGIEKNDPWIGIMFDGKTKNQDVRICMQSYESGISIIAIVYDSLILSYQGRKYVPKNFIKLNFRE
jgi:hypothetical protein